MKAARDKYDGQMDKQVIPLCDSLNELPGIHTIESCCGHGMRPLLVAFSVDTFYDLMPLLVTIDQRPKWSVQVSWASGGGDIYFILYGQRGDYEAADELAKALKEPQ